MKPRSLADWTLSLLIAAAILAICWYCRLLVLRNARLEADHKQIEKWRSINAKQN